VGNIELRDEEALSPVARLSTVLLDKLEDEHVHIIVAVRTPIVSRY
jgi:hypothetical protein